MIDTTKVLCALKQLSQRRPVFHSEADFQHALAWHLQGMFPDASVRLELPFRRTTAGAEYLDLLVALGQQKIAFELKYKTRSLKLQVNSEQFDILNHGAQDLGRYDFLIDTQRLERFVREGRAEIGFAILLTNDRSYWSPARRPVTVDEQFRLHEGRVVSGKMAWLSHASDGTTKGRKAPIDLRGTYTASWSDFSQINSLQGGNFRHLLWSVK